MNALPEQMDYSKLGKALHVFMENCVADNNFLTVVC